MLPNSNNPFLDIILQKLTTDQIVTDAIKQVAWQSGEDKKEYGLLKLIPRTAEGLEDLKELVADNLEEIAEDETVPKFKCSGQVVVDSTNIKNLILKIWPE